jgi:hypothetical protein
LRKIHKIAAAAAAAVILAGAGTAWAQDAGPNGVDGGAAANQAGVTALGGGQREAVFTAITPCRLVDTREIGGDLAPSETRAYDVRGTGGTFANQGGKVNGCGIPSGATAVEVTVTAVTPSATGFLRVFPGAEPQATFLNYPGGISLGNTGTVALCGSSGELCLINADLRVKNFGGPTELVVDVQGYYQQQLGAQVDAAGALGRNNRALSAVQVTPGQYEVEFDRNVVSCVYNANVGAEAAGSANGYATVQPRSGDASAVFVQTFNDAGALASLPFYVTVTC